MTRPKFTWWKLIAVWVLFLALHFSYETFPNSLFQILGEVGETTYFHMKMLFFAYVLVTLAEFLVRRKKLVSPAGFVYSRALIAVAYPWLAITLWFTAEALGLVMPNLAIELVYANVTTAIGIYLALRMEEALDGVDFRPSLRALVIVLFACATVSYVAFSLHTPLHFFTQPPGF